MNVRGTGAVLQAATAAAVRRVVVVSTIAVYGHGRGDLLDEESPAKPDSFYGETKLQAERLALEARRSDGEPLCTVARSAAVYGPRIKGNYRRLLEALARGRFVPVCDGRSRRTLVFDRDLAAALVSLARCDDAAGRIYNVTMGTCTLWARSSMPCARRSDGSASPGGSGTGHARSRARR